MRYGYKKKFLSRRGTSDYITSRRALSQYRAGTLRRRGSADQRQLADVVQLHRRANPYQITPASGRTVTFWRKTELNLALNQSTGFGIGGLNLNFGFALGYVFGYLNGAFTYAPTVPNASDFQALFDYYQIKAVKLQMFFTKNTSDQSGGSTIGMPILIVCNDFDDVQEPMTLALMNQRVGVRHVQFSADNQNGINHYIKPRPSTVVVQTDFATGVQTSANAGIPMGSTWLDCAQSNILHNGIKIFYDNQGLTTATNLGNITFVFDICYEFKGYR